jgi:hypothetical protein
MTSQSLKYIIPTLYLIWIGILCLWFLKVSGDKTYSIFVMLYLAPLAFSELVYLGKVKIRKTLFSKDFVFPLFLGRF